MMINLQHGKIPSKNINHSHREIPSSKSVTQMMELLEVWSPFLGPLMMEFLQAKCPFLGPSMMEFLQVKSPFLGVMCIPTVAIATKYKYGCDKNGQWPVDGGS